jgi:hypothetical protein
MLPRIDLRGGNSHSLYHQLKEDFVLIGKINDKSRQKILVTIKEVKGSRLVDLRLHQTNDEGEFVATPSGVSLTVEQTDQAIELLKEARKKICQD